MTEQKCKICDVTDKFLKKEELYRTKIQGLEEKIKELEEKIEDFEENCYIVDKEDFQWRMKEFVRDAQSARSDDPNGSHIYKSPGELICDTEIIISGVLGEEWTVPEDN